MLEFTLHLAGTHVMIQNPLDGLEHSLVLQDDEQDVFYSSCSQGMDVMCSQFIGIGYLDAMCLTVPIFQMRRCGWSEALESLSAFRLVSFLEISW